MGESIMKIIKSFQIAFAVLCMSATSCLGDPYSLKEDKAEEHVKHYNTLPYVGIADADLKTQPQFHDFLSRAREVIASYNGFSDHTGLRLVHRHFDLKPENVVVQQFSTYEKTPSLISSALPLAEALAKDAVPSGWVFGVSSPQIFEFSTDEAVKKDLHDIKSTPEFLEQMEIVIKDFHLEGLMSVSLLRNASLVAQIGEVYQENTYDFGSVVQVIDAKKIVPTHIRTSWSFRGPRQVACEAWCQQYCSEDQFSHHRDTKHWANHRQIMD